MIDDGIGAHALAYAARGWSVFPLGMNKVPRIKGGHGHLDATTDLDQIAQWWTQYPDANIGMRPPSNVIVIDIDPRNGGEETWERLTRGHPLIETLTVISGRGDGGRHLYFTHPWPPKGRLGDGVDLKRHTGFVVLPPSLHRCGGRYRWLDVAAPIVALPSWLEPVPKPMQKHVPRVYCANGDHDSPADWFTDTHSWHDVLTPHGWWCRSGDGDSDGSVWMHPTHTSNCSATIRHGCLFVYSTSTCFEPTEAEDPNGYTRFKAWAWLDHGGDQRRAARAVIELRRQR